MSSTDSIPPISIGVSSRKVFIFTIELPRGHPLSSVFTNPDIVAVLVYEHTTVEPVVAKGVDERNTLWVFVEGEDVEELCQKLWSIEVWLGHSVHTGCDIATPEQMMLEEGLQWVEREEDTLGGRCKYADIRTNVSATAWEFLAQCNLTGSGENAKI